MTIAERAITPPSGRAADDPGFSAALASEWMKLRTARVIVRRLLLAVVLGIVAGGLMSLLVGATFDEWSATDQADFDPLVYPMIGSLLSLLLVTSASVGFVTREHNAKMVGLTYLATPRRGRVLAAKAVVMGVAGTLASSVAMIGMFVAGQLAFSATDLPTATVDGDVLRAAAVMIPVGAVFPALAVLVATIVRSTASSFMIVVLMILGPDLFGALAPDWWRRNVLSLLPGPATDAVALSHVTDSIYYLHPLAAGVVLALWLGGLALVARVVQERRDA